MKQTTKPTVYALFLLLLGGCVAAQKYPEQWAKGFPETSIRAGDKCDLTGSYADVAEQAPGQKKSVQISLYGILFPDSGVLAESTPDRISLEGPVAGELRVVAWKNGKAVEARKLKSLGCLENGLVMINPGMVSWSSDFAVTFGVGNQDNFLYRGSDGWLILKKNELKVVIPWFDFETSWYRFRPVDSMQ